MAFWNLGALPLAEFRPGIMSKAEFGQNLIMACMRIAENMEDSGHDHPFDQCGVVIEGRIEMFVGADRRLLTVNDSYFIPAGVRHGWKTLDDPVKILDVSVKQP
jgi:quercetin dioxygenase-like cupin family protein